ncbi:DMT family transporter [Myceligenerans halotolerans]
MTRWFPLADRFPVAAALLVTVLWSSSWVLIKLGLDDLPPLTFAGLRYTVASAILLAALLADPGGRRQAATLPARTWGRLAALGVVMYAVTQGAQFVGLSLLPAATLSLLLSFTPLLVLGGSRLLLNEPGRPGQRIGVLLALGGAMLYLLPGLGVTSLVGLAVGVVGLAANAGASMLGRAANRGHDLPALVVTAPSMAIGGLLLVVTGLLTEPAPRLDAGSWVILGWLAAINTAFAFTLWNHTLRHLSATESSAVNNTMLIQIALLAWLFLGETPSPPQWAGIGAVALGTWWVQRPRRR